MKRAMIWILTLALSAALCGCSTPPPPATATPVPTMTPAPTPSPVAPSPTPVPTPQTVDFTFTRENLPRLNGSTSTVPLAQAVCSVLLGESRDQVADLTQFSRTTASYLALMNDEADLLLAGEPEGRIMDQLAEGDQWLLTPFATDALVFLVGVDNPVDSLTVEQVQKIYTGEVTNWSQVGGHDLDIVPFQRNSQAGSQALMKKLVMGDLELMTPPSDYVATSMGELVEAVRQFDGGPAAIGYTVYYYANDMKMAQGMKILQIDDVAPEAETIRDGSYPFLNPYYVAIRKDAPADSPTRILYDWVLGEEGQRLVAHEGYVSVTEVTNP